MSEVETQLTPEQKDIVLEYLKLAQARASSYGFAIKKLGRDDAIGEAYLAIVKGVKTWGDRGGDNLIAYLSVAVKASLTRASFRASTIVRKPDRRERYPDELTVLSYDSADTDIWSVPDPHGNDDATYSDEIMEMLRAAMQHLSSVDQDIVLQRSAGVKAGKIASDHDMAFQTVLKRYNEALHTLRQMMKAESTEGGSNV